MQFNKAHHPVNAVFATGFSGQGGGRLRIREQDYACALADLGDDIFRIEIGHAKWGQRLSLNELNPPAKPAPSAYRLAFDAAATLTLTDAAGATVMESRPSRAFGTCGQTWLLNLAPREGDRHYGLGEQWMPMERSKRMVRVFNADVWADHPFPAIEKGTVSPLYMAMPYVIIKRGETFIGVFIDSPHYGFIATNPTYHFTRDPAQPPEENLFLGCDDGKPIVYLLVGPTLAALTEKFQRLLGTVPLPPLWALGHHQCRWGYRSAKDLERLDREFTRNKIPTDGLWLDIDYMDRFKVFTFDAKHFPDPAAAIARLEKRGRKVVPIIDPGVKRQAGYAVYDSGIAGGHFCKTGEGEPYTGFVWPGETHFPDFTEPAARAWWAGWCAKFFAQGPGGAWLDMNDVACGGIESDHCRFRNGTLHHAVFRNHYAYGMAEASHAGFRQTYPDRRPFLLSRSGSPGIAKWAANWTGDNVSNEAHLGASIPCTVNLALSGQPFNGPDVPGFGGNTTDDLAARWYKAGFLFPVLRNHASHDAREQEPWVFPPRIRAVIAHAIRTRYKLLPYLYNLFIDQEERGTAIMRPLIHDFAERDDLPLAAISDQFLVGPAIMQAPLLRVADKRRQVVLPDARWYDAAAGRWLAGARTVWARDVLASTPLYVRGGSLVPMLVGERTTNASDLREIELHCFLPRGGEGAYRYRCDAGEGYAYRDGERSAFTAHARSHASALELAISDVVGGYGPCRVRVVAYGGEKKLHHDGRELALKPHRWTFAGAPLKCAISPVITI
jgi:alpha-glucosidase